MDKRRASASKAGQVKHMEDRAAIVEAMREFNRFYTDILGLLDRHILDSGYSLAEARILYEIHVSDRCIASDLAAALRMDKSYLSRILRKLEKAKLLCREQAEGDGRANALSLTAEGRRCLAALSRRSDAQMAQLLTLMPDAECRRVREAMDTIRSGFRKASEIAIRPYSAADVAFVTDYQIRLYTDYGFTSDIWHAYVQGAVLDFHRAFDPAKDAMWIVEHRGTRAGCIAITHRDTHTAQLRFFFVDAALQGRGMGNRLMEMALDFCRQKGYRSVYLLTCNKLLAARHLYKKYGFTLTGAQENLDWGEPMTEEHWLLALPENM